MQEREPAAVPATSCEIAVISTNTDGVVTVFNDSASSLLGYEPDEIIGQSAPIVNFAEMLGSQEQAHTPLESQLIHKNGDLLGTELFTSAIKNEHGDTTGYLFTTTLHTNQQALSLTTDLPDLSVFNIVLEREIRRTQREHQPLSVLIIDVDNYKAYQEHYGNEETEKCLNRIAVTLSERVQRASDLLVYGGFDEFLVLLPNTDRSGTVKVAEQLRLRIASLGIEHVVSAVGDTVTVSIGVVNMTADEAVSAAEIIAKARATLERAKQDGRNCTRIA